MQRIGGAGISAGLVALLAALAACDGGDPTTGELETFTATLSPGAVNGADVVSDGSGTATFTWDGSVLEYEITVADIDEVTAAHVHGPASPSQNAAAILALFSPSEPTGPVNGTLVVGAVDPTTPSLSSASLDYALSLMRADSAYVMVHSVTYPDGEIRGAIVPD